MPSIARTPQASAATDYPPGSRWLHLWVETIPCQRYVVLGVQYETVGVRITEAPCLSIDPTAAALLLDALATVAGAVTGDCSVSIPVG